MKPCRQCGWPYDVGTDGLCKSCRELKEHPDALSKRTSLGGVPFRDMKHMDEPDRIAYIVELLTKNPGRQIAAMVDVGDGHADKGDRYIRGVRAKVPTVKVVSRKPGPVPAVETITFKLPL